MVYISKTLIPGKTPIGSATGGGYMYDDKDRPASTFSSTQNMSVPGQNMSFTPKQQPVSPFIQSIGKIPGVGDTPITPFAPSVGFSPERAKQINAPVQDTLNFRAKINEADDRVKKLREHFRSLEQKGNFQLNKKQSDYIKKFKVKHPSYANVPDVSLYSKIILAEPKAMEQYGNIGEKGFLQNFAETPFNIAKSGAETVQRYADRYSQDVVKGGGGAFDTLAAIGGATGGVVMDVVGNTLNIASPLLKRDNSRFATSITEGLGADVKAAIPETVLTTIDDLSKRYPTIAEYVEKGLDISNLIPFLGALGKAKSATQVDDILRQVKTSTSRTLVPGEILPGLRTAGKNIQRTVTPDVISKDVATLRAERLRQGLETQNNNLKTVGNAFRNNTKKLDTGEVVTPIDTFEKYGITPDIDEKTIRMGDFITTREGGLGKIQDNVELIGDEIDSILVSTGKKLKTDDYRARAIEGAKKSPELKQSGKVQSTIDKINTRFDDYKQSYGDEIDIFEVNNIRKTANKDWSPDTQDVSSIVGDVGRDIVYNATDDMAVKKLLREQGNLLAARKYAQALNGTKIRGGRLGDYFAGGTGAVVGALAGTMLPIPVIGPAIGAGVGQQVGTKLSKLFSATQFKSPMAELKGLFKSEGVGLPKGKAKQQIKASILDRLPKAKSIPPTSSSLPSQTSEVSSIQKLLQEPQKPQQTPGKSSVLSQLSKGKEKSAGKKVNNPIIQKLAKKQETPKTPQVEGKTVEKIKAMQLEQEDMIRKGESISEDFRNKWNDLQSQYKKEFIDSRIASERKKVDSAIRDIETKIKENPSRTDWGKKQIQMEEEGFNRLKKGDYFEKKYQEHISKIREEAKNSSLLKSVKERKSETPNSKRALPMSQKSDVGKTDDYFYHGTSQGAFEQIQKEGIKPQGRGVSSLSKTEEYSRNWAFPEATGTKGVMLRVKKDFMEGKLFNTTKQRPKSDEMYELLTKETIPPEALEILKDGKWQPLVKPKPSLPLSSKSEVKEAPKTPQVEGKTVPKEILDEMNNYDNAHDFAMNAMIGPGGKVYKIGDNVKVETMAGTVDGKITKNIGKTNIVDEGKPKSSGYIQDSPNGHPVQVTLKDGTKIDTNLGLIDQDSTGDYIFGKKQSDKLRELFESKAKPKPSLTLSQKSEGKTLKDNLEWTPSSKLDQDIFYVDRNGIRQTEFESAGKNIKGQRAGYTMEEYLNKNGLSKDDFTLSKGTDGADGLYVLNEKGLSKLEKLRAGNKPKPSLPLSQKSEVKYSKPDLTSEARKYKSASEFEDAVKKKINKVFILNGRGLEDVSVIGSTARGKLKPNDLDILVTPKKKYGELKSEDLYDRIDLQNLIKDEIQSFFPDKKIHITISQHDLKRGPKISISDLFNKK